MIEQRAASQEYVAKLLSEKPISTSVAAKFFGDLRGGKSVAPSTLVRWMRHGIVLRDGRRAHLEFLEIGRKLCTTHAAIIRFLAAQQQTIDTDSPVVRSPAEREHAAKSVIAELRESNAI